MRPTLGITFRAKRGKVHSVVGPRLLDLFCGVGGWSKWFHARGWKCTGVDIVNLGYPFELVQADVLTLDGEWIDGFDGVVASPPCEEYARAWLPWLRGDHKPDPKALNLLQWAIRLCDRPRRLVECSRFSARHVHGATFFGSYALWGDVPALMPTLPRGKMRKSGLHPELRAEIPKELADWIARLWTETYWSNARNQGLAPQEDTNG